MSREVSSHFWTGTDPSSTLNGSFTTIAKVKRSSKAKSASDAEGEGRRRRGSKDGGGVHRRRQSQDALARLQAFGGTVGLTSGNGGFSATNPGRLEIPLCAQRSWRSTFSCRSSYGLARKAENVFRLPISSSLDKRGVGVGSFPQSPVVESSLHSPYTRQSTEYVMNYFNFSDIVIYNN